MWNEPEWCMFGRYHVICKFNNVFLLHKSIIRALLRSMDFLYGCWYKQWCIHHLSWLWSVLLLIVISTGQHSKCNKKCKWIKIFALYLLLIGVCSNHIWILPSKWTFWYEIKAPILLIMPVKFSGRQMLLEKITSKNLATLRYHNYHPCICATFLFYLNKSLLDLILYRCNETIRFFFWYQNLESNKHLKNNIGTKTLITCVNRFGVNSAL